MARGRKSILTIELVDTLADGIRLGMPIDLACDRARISRGIYYKWMAGEFPKSISKTVQAYFFDTIKAAAADAVFDALTSIRNASQGKQEPGSQWQAAAWFLERRYPQEFGRRQVEVSGSNGGPIMHMLTRYVAEMSEAAGVDPEDVQEIVLERLGSAA